GTSADNALAESFNSTMKTEVLRNRKVFANSLQCRREVFRWCIRYNTQRRHFWCGQISPDVFEAQSITLTKAA
ncbi:transposase, partial [Corynebacterium belfantii]|uniref:integrase core domain-containing protein n=1 Tax=Corynebacterium belfantii TaxID=2014537 RepID=UPI0018D4A196